MDDPRCCQRGCPCCARYTHVGGCTDVGQARAKIRDRTKALWDLAKHIPCHAAADVKHMSEVDREKLWKRLSAEYKDDVTAAFNVSGLRLQCAKSS